MLDKIKHLKEKVVLLHNCVKFYGLLYREETLKNFYNIVKLIISARRFQISTVNIVTELKLKDCPKNRREKSGSITYRCKLNSYHRI